MKNRILVVEDFRSVRTFLCDTLSRKGFATVSASNISEACTIMQHSAQAFHLVLTNYMMEGGTGYDLLKQIRSTANTRHIPVIILTSENDSGLIRQAQDAGVTAWINTPYMPEDFIDQIRRAIDSQP
jgi:two-component system chemotaxis response regulator CheY